MSRKIFLILIPAVVAFSAPTKQVKNENLELLRKVEHLFHYLKKSVRKDRVLYKDVVVEGQLNKFKVKKLMFYLDTPLLVGEAFSIISGKGNSTYTAERVDFVLQSGKLFSIVHDAEVKKKNILIKFPEIVNTLVWNTGSAFYTSRAPFEFIDGKDTFNDTLNVAVDVSLQKDGGVLLIKLHGESSKLASVETSLEVRNVPSELLKVLREAKPKNGKIVLDKKATDLLLSVVPEELSLEFTINPFLERILVNDESTPQDIKHLQEQLKKVKKGSLDERILKALLHILKGESNSIVIKVKNKSGINLGQIVSLGLMVSMAPNIEQAIKLLAPYFDIKIVDF